MPSVFLTVMQEQLALSPEAARDKLIEEREARLEHAECFLEDFFSVHWYRFSRDVHEAADEARISRSLLYRAAEELGIVTTLRMPEQHARGVWWFPRDDADAEDEADVEPEEFDDLSRDQLVSELGETIRVHFEGNASDVLAM